jgi:integrase/recombinase XerC
VVKQSKSIRYLSHNQWQHLKDLQKPRRDQLILEILYSTGCTVNELVNIKISDFDLKANQLAIRPGNARNKEPRKVYITDGLAASVKHFAQGNTGYLFFTRQSDRMTTKRICQLVQKYCRLCKISNASPQILRYTHIVHAYEKKIPLSAIQKQVGLKRSRAIEIFQQLPELEEKDAYKRFAQ